MLKPESALRKDLTTGRVTMQHRHYATIASIIRDIPDAGYRADVAAHFASALAGTNPNFNRDRFLSACLAD
jgi:phage replication-related protein YjqB (UPF0714/DUF867 family)